jgi:hypothetical protein
MFRLWTSSGDSWRGLVRRLKWDLYHSRVRDAGRTIVRLFLVWNCSEASIAPKLCVDVLRDEAIGSANLWHGDGD